MKKVIFLMVLLSVFMVGCFDDNNETSNSARKETTKAQSSMYDRAVQAVPIPQVDYFQERRTVAKWAERWDVPSVPTYVYLFAFNNCIDYYVADGKPASTRSYLMPEENYIDDPNGSYDAGSLILSAPDIDGTNGDNNPGIRFFTATGVAVEFGGQGMSYLYSDAPLPLNVPKLN